MRRSLLVLFILFLLAMIASLVLAVVATRTSPLRYVPAENLEGPQAAAHGWPAPTPHPWPPPTGVQVARAFAVRDLEIYCSPQGLTSHQMKFSEFGWPLPVLTRAQMWWPWDDPRWASSVSPDPVLAIDWRGLLVDSFVIAMAIWAPFALPLLLARWWRRRRRLARGQCVGCAYPLLAASVCPECGLAAPKLAA